MLPLTTSLVGVPYLRHSQAHILLNFLYPKHQNNQPSGSVRHPQQRWDCDTYYDPDADQTSGMSYTCHGGFSDGAPFGAHFLAANKKQELCEQTPFQRSDVLEGCTSYFCSWSLCFFVFFFAGIELFDCKFFDISPAEARGGNSSEWCSQPPQPMSCCVGNLTGMDPTQRQVLEARVVPLLKSRKGSSCFFCFL